MKKPKLGATGEFPYGKLNPDDEGQLRFAVAHKGNNLVIDFGKPVHWLGLPLKEAEEFIEILIKQINEIREENSMSPWQNK